MQPSEPTADAPTLADLGWQPFFASQVTAQEAETCQPVRVTALYRGLVTVTGEGVDQLIGSRLAESRGDEDRATVGDWLLIDRETLAVVRILDRTSLFKRPAPGDDRRLQLIAANVDTLFIVTSCNDDFNIARLERYLVLAREAEVTPVVVLTKIDLADDPEHFRAQALALQPGLGVELVNARDPHSVARLASRCGEGHTVALLGSSGVGKSTLVNTLRGTDSITTQSVRDHDDKGRHTTTVRAMHRLAGGGWLIDAPGMREFRIADAPTGIAEVFDDIAALVLECRFTNCTHVSEPGCAIQAAIAGGTLEPARLARWAKLAAEDEMGTAQQATRKARVGKPGKRN